MHQYPRISARYATPEGSPTVSQDWVTLSSTERSRLFKANKSISEILVDHNLSAVIVEALHLQVDLLRRVIESNGQLARHSVEASVPLDGQLRLLITIAGITPPTVSGFLADVGDVHRFPGLRRMNAYPGLVPRCHDSGGKSAKTISSGSPAS